MKTFLTQTEKLTPCEACRWLKDRTGVKPSVATIHRWLNRGARGVTLASQRVGGVTYIATEDLEAFLAACNSRPRPRTTTLPLSSAASAPEPPRESAIHREQIKAGHRALRAKLGRPHP